MNDQNTGSIDEGQALLEEPDFSAYRTGPNVPEFTQTGGLSEDEMDRLTNDIIGAIKTVFDPEIPADIYELGLIYKVAIDNERLVMVDMTLTAPGCPVAGEMPIWVQDAVESVAGVGQVRVSMVFDPFWTPERMSEEAQVALNWYY